MILIRNKIYIYMAVVASSANR